MFADGRVELNKETNRHGYSHTLFNYTVTVFILYSVNF